MMCLLFYMMVAVSTISLLFRPATHQIQYTKSWKWTHFHPKNTGQISHQQKTLFPMQTSHFAQAKRKTIFVSYANRKERSVETMNQKTPPTKNQARNLSQLHPTAYIFKQAFMFSHDKVSFFSAPFKSLDKCSCVAASANTAPLRIPANVASVQRLLRTSKMVKLCSTTNQR